MMTQLYESYEVCYKYFKIFEKLFLYTLNHNVMNGNNHYTNEIPINCLTKTHTLNGKSFMDSKKKQ